MPIFPPQHIRFLIIASHNTRQSRTVYEHNDQHHSTKQKHLNRNEVRGDVWRHVASRNHGNSPEKRFRRENKLTEVAAPADDRRLFRYESDEAGDSAAEYQERWIDLAPQHRQQHGQRNSTGGPARYRGPGHGQGSGQQQADGHRSQTLLDRQTPGPLLELVPGSSYN